MRWATLDARLNAEGHVSMLSRIEAIEVHIWEVLDDNCGSC
jgi:hypothetical protein